MSTQAFGVSIGLAPSVLPTPTPVLQKSSRPTDIEMKPLNPGAGREMPASKHGSIIQTPVGSKTPNELEMSHPSSPQGGPGVDVVQTFWNPYMNRFRLAAACVISLGLGLNDSSSGALLAYIEKQANSLSRNTKVERLIFMQRLRHRLCYCFNHFRISSSWICWCSFHCQCVSTKIWTSENFDDSGSVDHSRIRLSCYDTAFPCCGYRVRSV